MANGVAIPLTSTGQVLVSTPNGDPARSECLRDLKRSISGGCVFIVGRERRYPVVDPAREQGDVSKAACEAALEELARAIGRELLAQKQETQVQSLVQDEQPKLQVLAMRVAAHINVSPGMQAVLCEKLPPALWQPAFAVCIGRGQVRVLTLAFVGGPVVGDRPSCKRTPFLLRLTSGDLAEKSNADEESMVRFRVVRAIEGLQSVEKHLVAMSEELFSMANGAERLENCLEEPMLPGSPSIVGPHVPPARPPLRLPAAPVTPGQALRPTIQWWEELLNQRAQGVSEKVAETTGTEKRGSFGDKVAQMRAIFSGAGRQVEPAKPPVVRTAVDRQARMRARWQRADSPAELKAVPARQESPSLQRPQIVDRQAKLRAVFSRAESPSCRPGGQAQTVARAAETAATPPTPSAHLVDRAARMRASIRSQVAVAPAASPWLVQTAKVQQQHQQQQHQQPQHQQQLSRDLAETHCDFDACTVGQQQQQQANVPAMPELAHIE
ncbi:unnamed protein product [Polarella glacialis]|uniref:Uncharacterized protein n=1 Tax=Polarella glacialis TaxID=89957 RepID=A0A813LR63_POLGL|nr:unnamed protein product [Polarella glacialis]